MMMVNLLLAAFNLLPFPPLDGFQAVISLFAALRVAFGKAAPAEPVSWTGLPKVAREEASEQLAERSPAQIHFDIGLDYQKADEWDEAIARYRQATAHDEQFSLAYYNLGLAYWAKGRASLAVSAFRAAVESKGDLSIKALAELRLRELARAEEDPGIELGPAPPPLEPGEAATVNADEASPLDPVVVRRVWIGLGIGGVGLCLLAVSAWLYVTAVALSEAGGMGLM
jgi:tetratricopeptide (TPR) repeat protein